MTVMLALALQSVGARFQNVDPLTVIRRKVLVDSAHSAHSAGISVEVHVFGLIFGTDLGGFGVGFPM
jgi:hypothetical protein